MSNKVALKYHQPARVLCQGTPSGTDYVFAVEANIALAWVEEEDVDHLLARKAGCNCGGSKKKQAYYRANEDDIRRWTNRGGR